MNQPSPPPHEVPRAHRLRRMTGRDPRERHRVATPLELLFDLTFVVAFGLSASEFAHLLVTGHVGRGTHGLPVRDLRDLLGVDQLHLVCVGVRHRRLGLPADDHGADGRRADPRARPATVLRLHRARRSRGQRGSGRWVRGDANRLGGTVVTRCPAGPRAQVGLPDLRDRGDHRADRLDRDRVPARVRAVLTDGLGAAGALRDAGPVAGRAPRRHAVARPPHRRALQLAGDHRAR